MPTPLYPPAGPQSIGQVLDTAFRIFQASFVRCLLYGALSMIAGQLPNLYFIASGKPLSAFGGGDPLWIALYVLGAIITILMFAALVLRQHDIASGVRRTTSIEISQAVRRFPGYLGGALLGGLIGSLGPILIGLIFYLVGPSTLGYALLIGLSVIGLVPLLYIMPVLMLSTPALLIDAMGPARSIHYSLHIIRGSWWRTSAIFSVALVILLVSYATATVVIGIVLSILGAVDIAAIAAATGVVYVVLGGLGMPFFTAVILATYGELKVRREGIDLEQRVADTVQT